MTSAQGLWWRRLHNWADVIHADFQTVISCVQQNISTYPFCTAERMLRTVIMQNSRLIQACFPIKIDEVWIDRFCVRYDWWRRLQPPSSVSPVWSWKWGTRGLAADSRSDIKKREVYQLILPLGHCLAAKTLVDWSVNTAVEVWSKQLVLFLRYTIKHRKQRTHAVNTTMH